MIDFLTKHRKWAIPLLLMAAITPFTPFLDFEIARYFYQKGTPAEPFDQSQTLKFIYIYGLLPAQVTEVLAAAGLFISFVFESCKNWRKPTLLVLLTMLIGSGLITHLILKDHWGRPRPKQVIEFGGQQHFRPYFIPNFFNQPEPSKSFPCGHCSMGFFFAGFIVLGTRLKKKWLFYSGIVLTTILGAALSYTRMAQGGHFLSDVLFAGLIMWLTAHFLDKWIYGET